MKAYDIIIKLEVFYIYVLFYDIWLHLILYAYININLWIIIFIIFFSIISTFLHNNTYNWTRTHLSEDLLGWSWISIHPLSGYYRFHLTPPEDLRYYCINSSNKRHFLAALMEIENTYSHSLQVILWIENKLSEKFIYYIS